MPQLEQNKAGGMDLTFIGSGISTSFTLIPLLENLPFKKHLKIAIVEKSNELHTGLAYGPRSGASALLITSLADFLPAGKVRDEFVQWLSIHKIRLINELRIAGGELSEKWIHSHAAEIEIDQWENIYIPRCFFGTYIKEKTQYAIEQFNESNGLDIEYIIDEVLDIHQDENGFRITFKNRQDLASKRVVVSVGIPPVAQVWPDEEASRISNAACLISDPYNMSLKDNLSKIEHFVNQKTEKSNVLIIGANASAMEMIYKLNDVATIKDRIEIFYVISPQGELPNSAKDDNLNVNFVPEHLLQLNNKPSLTGLEIFEAANKDLDVAESLNYSTAISEAPISKAFTSLLNKLNTHELREFACHYGNEIGKRQRRAGKHYTDVVDQLRLENRLTNVKGYFIGLEEINTEKGINFKYKEKKDGKNKTFDKEVTIVINCMGSKTLENGNISPLLDNLISKNLCKVNDSNRGFLVNSKFEVAPGLHIMGPLLAGNLINQLPLWHIEHCGRIISLGNTLAKHLSESLTT